MWIHLLPTRYPFCAMPLHFPWYAHSSPILWIWSIVSNWLPPTAPLNYKNQLFTGMATEFGRDQFSDFEEIDIFGEIGILGNLFADYQGLLEVLLYQLESFKSHLPPSHIQTGLYMVDEYIRGESARKGFQEYMYQDLIVGWGGGVSEEALSERTFN